MNSTQLFESAISKIAMIMSESGPDERLLLEEARNAFQTCISRVLPAGLDLIAHHELCEQLVWLDEYSSQQKLSNHSKIPIPCVAYDLGGTSTRDACRGKADSVFLSIY